MTRSSGATPVHDPAGTLLAVDFDGTLSHIVDDPTQAFAHPGAVAALGRLGRVLGGVAIITGRPVAQALQLGGFESVEGLDRLMIRGQYGAEEWDAGDAAPHPSARAARIDGLAVRLPAILGDLGAGGARIEDKGLALAVHTRGLDPELAGRLIDPLRALAAEEGLHVEPGRQVIELRSSDVDKGTALKAIVETLGAGTVVFAGDDLGDLPAFDAVDDLRAQGLTGFLVASQSTEQDALEARADLVLEGPDAIAQWLSDWADQLGA